MLQRQQLGDICRTFTATIIICAVLSSVFAHVSTVDVCRMDLARLCNNCSYVDRLKLSDVASSVDRCEWFLEAAPDRLVLVEVEEVRLVHRPWSSLKLIVDGNVTEITEDCTGANCLPDISGKSLRVIWVEDRRGQNKSEMAHFPFSAVASSTFTLRYAVFHNATLCRVPRVLVNVDVENASSSVGGGGGVRYRCFPRHATDDGSEVVDAFCRLAFDSLSGPSWSRLPPVCRLTQCAGKSVVVTIRRGQSRVLDYDGAVDAGEVCVWQILSKEESILQLSLEWVSVEKGSLQLYDGDLREDRLLARFTDTAQLRNFSFVHQKIVVVLNAGGSPKTTTTATAHNVSANFRAKISALESPCQLPTAIGSVDVRGDDVIDSTNITAVYYCSGTGRQLVGSGRVWCQHDGSWSSSTPTCEPTTEDPVVDHYLKGDKVEAKASHVRPDKLLRPHPQSTEDKIGKKAGSKETSESKLRHEAADVVNVTLVPPPSGFPEDDVPSDPEPDWRIGSGELDYADVMSGSSDLENYDREGDLDFLEEGESEETVDDGSSGSVTFPVLVVVGVTLPLLICTTIIVSCLVYRKLYPVRMGPGRKFETFENPIYDRNRRPPSGPGPSGNTLSRGPAHSPAELERLTVS